MNNLNYFLADEEATISVGTAIANAVKITLKKGIVVFLNGDLGAGKTTLTRGFVRGMGHAGNVKSPTYTIVEPYELADWRVYHFDLYRLSDPEELEYMGIRDYFEDNCCCFIEWPEKGQGILTQPDMIINLTYVDEQRTISLESITEKGSRLIAALPKVINEAIPALLDK
jgi:tRNA threonylcarbamoyladenosine biosynthesis protein TsaE